MNYFCEKFLDFNWWDVVGFVRGIGEIIRKSLTVVMDDPKLDSLTAKQLITRVMSEE